MKSKIKNCCFRLFLSVTVFGLCLSLTSCKSTKAKEETIRIGVAVYQQDDTFITTIVQNFEKYVRETETAQNIKINVTILDGQSNQTVQLEQISRLLEQGCNVLCVNIVDRTAAAVIIDKAQKAEVPLIFFNRQPVEEDMVRWENAFYVGAQAAQSGRIQGEIVRDLWQEKGSELDKNNDNILQYIMLEGEPGHQDTSLRTQYSLQALNTASIKTEKLASQTASWKRSEAASLVTDYISTFENQIEVIFANNDDMALGAIDAYKALGISDKELPVIVGVDATPPAIMAINDGTLKGTVLNDSKGIADAMLDLALALYKAEPAENAVTLENQHYVWLDYAKVTKETLNN